MKNILLLAVLAASNTAWADQDQPTGLLQPGAPLSNCAKWFVAPTGLTCSHAAETFGISVDQILALNPQLEGDCKKNYWAGYSYCHEAPGTDKQADKPVDDGKGKGGDDGKGKKKPQADAADKSKPKAEPNTTARGKPAITTGPAPVQHVGGDSFITTAL
ncbi:hypothetical protein F4778DRAFT_761402 [Xylariomycetidae sp. FL2044]|nr:hypothetical protein F4778DRAFT_761402 [Xylariomycetidae sp. FL2044]